MTGSFDSFARVWGSHGNLIGSISSDKATIKAVEWITDDIFVAGDAKNNIFGYQIVDESISSIFSCTGHSASIESFAASNDASKLASTSWDKSIKLWSMDKAESTDNVENSLKKKNKKQRVSEVKIKVSFN